MKTRDILSNLIAFPTVSADPNRALIDYCADILRHSGAELQIIENETGDKANLYATIGPRDRAGVLLSGHTDVVPVAGQDWTRPPFEMTAGEGKLFGRGTADMKGFVACALTAAQAAATRDLQTPLHLALSYDEEIGCVGVRSMIDMLAQAPFRPMFCIVGEPTQMAVATGHKGKLACRTTCFGQEGHSALAPFALNAIYMVGDMIAELRAILDDLAQAGVQDGDYDVPHTTLHVGHIEGGGPLNIVPNRASFLWEIRNLPEDDPKAILDRMQAKADQMVADLRPKFPGADITFEITNTYPPLGTAPTAEVVAFVQSLTGANGTMKVAFGTEGGLFDRELGVPTVICGPGSMEQGHKPDEFIAIEQLDKCDAMLARLVGRLETGL